MKEKTNEGIKICEPSIYLPMGVEEFWMWRLSAFGCYNTHPWFLYEITLQK